MKNISVVAAGIFHTNPESHQKEIFDTWRWYGQYKDWWEFSVGKIEEKLCPKQINIF